MPGVNTEQIEQAKQWDLLSYLQQYEPGELKKTGPHEFCTVTHDSLKISNGKWNWTTRGFGGKTALDYLIKVKDMILKASIEEAKRRDALQIEAFGGHMDGPELA